MMMYDLTLLRHGESEGNLAGVLQGQSDFPLTKLGEQQASRLGVFWKTESINFDLIISSPLQRASRTAEIISSCLQVPIIYSPAWMERNFGQLQGEKLTDLQKRNPPIDYFHPYDPIGKTGESQLDLYTRASLAIQDLLRLTAGSYLVVSHGGILNNALYVIMGITPQVHYQSPVFHFANAGYAQFRYNQISRQWAVMNLNNRVSVESFTGDFDWKSD